MAEQQLGQWRSSRHAGALSPGLWAQLVDYVDSSPAFVTECLACHAPLQEQIERALVLREQATDLGAAGVDCAGCHVRGQRYYGPGRPASPDRLVASAFDAGHHGGVEPAPELFGASAFCAPCHQFDAGGLALDGKLLQNTHAEWRDSPARSQGRTCQDCHMPDGDHRMRGIHDRDLVSTAVELDVTWEPDRPARGRFEVSLRSHDAGHALPTYATGALLVKVFLSDTDDAVLANSLRTRVVQRRLSQDGQRQLFDTRIPAGGIWSYTGELDVDDRTRFLNVLVEVDPDHFYRGFFALLEPQSDGARRLLERARGAIAGSPYILFARQIRIAELE